MLEKHAANEDTTRGMTVWNALRLCPLLSPPIRSTTKKKNVLVSIKPF